MDVEELEYMRLDHDCFGNKLVPESAVQSIVSDLKKRLKQYKEQFKLYQTGECNNDNINLKKALWTSRLNRAIAEYRTDRSYDYYMSEHPNSKLKSWEWYRGWKFAIDKCRKYLEKFK